jgi:hypothetical protein
MRSVWLLFTRTSEEVVDRRNAVVGKVAPVHDLAACGHGIVEEPEHLRVWLEVDRLKRKVLRRPERPPLELAATDPPGPEPITQTS